MLERGQVAAGRGGSTSAGPPATRPAPRGCTGAPGIPTTARSVR